MSAIGNKKIEISQLLLGARVDEGLSREEAAARSGVSVRYIAFFEGDLVSGFTNDIFARKKLAEYSRFLGFDPNEMVRSFHETGRTTNGWERRPSRIRRHPLREIPFFRFLVTPNVVRATLVGAIIVAVGLFLTAKAYRMISPPQLVLSSPQEDGLVVHDRLITISGKTEKEALLSINGKLITIDGNGQFTDQLDLREGLNVITVTASRKHGQRTEVTRRIVVEPKDRPTANLNL